MSGFSQSAEPSAYQMATAAPRGHILHDYLEARVLPKITGPVGPGNLQYTAMWKVAQRLTRRPVKFNTILPELLAASVSDDCYKDPVERSWALSDALNSELHELADAGCPVIQMEEPQIHIVPVRGKPFAISMSRSMPMRSASKAAHPAPAICRRSARRSRTRRS
jgi:5-methyltetrahydropteroyltriglutamate--homocysteine methyltransferase